MDKQTEQHRNIMNRLQEMQKEQLLISSLNVAFSLVLDKKQLQAVAHQNFKTELQFNHFIILKSDQNKLQLFIDSFDSKNIENGIDDCFEQCLHSAEPVIFDLKDFSENKTSTPLYFINAKKSSMRTAIGFCLTSIEGSKNVVFLFYKNFTTLEDRFERILRGISTQLSITIRNILISQQLYTNSKIESDFDETKEEISQKGFQGIIGESEVMNDIFEKISQVAPSESNVLIYGETGTGKELIAQAIHQLSNFSKKKMVRINCAAIPSNLIESELFGHEKGSFTGATEQRKGKFEEAHNSTIFLDEIGELPLELQGRLLRVLQEKEIERIGGNKRIKINARVITATNRNLEREVAEGRFRSDLFYRLNVFPIALPALRERKVDIPLLGQYFLEKLYLKTGKKINGFSQKVMNLMIENPWPGNIRELENMIERSVLLTKTQTITTMDFPKIFSSENINPEFQIKTLKEFEKEYILKVVKKCNGKIFGELGAAKLLGLPPTTLISKMQKLGIEKKHHFKE